ncbi:Uncharacterised protein [Vibrio cholerae]|nr:Uncharacterised protein [Vibrio cholerae]
MSKLDRVIEQIEQDLVNPDLIAAHNRCGSDIGIHHQFQAFFIT